MSSSWYGRPIFSLIRFHNAAEEISLNYDVVPPLSDDVQLTVEEYRNKLYEVTKSLESLWLPWLLCNVSRDFSTKVLVMQNIWSRVMISVCKCVANSLDTGVCVSFIKTYIHVHISKSFNGYTFTQVHKNSCLSMQQILVCTGTSVFLTYTE